MPHIVTLTDLSNSLSKSMGFLEQRLAESIDQVHGLSDAVAKLNPNSLSYALQKKTTDDRLKSYSHDLHNFNNIISSSLDTLDNAKGHVQALSARVEQLKADQEWADAGGFKRSCLRVAYGCQTVGWVLGTPVRFLQQNRGSLTIGGALVISAGLGFAAGKALRV